MLCSLRERLPKHHSRRPATFDVEAAREPKLKTCTSILGMNMSATAPACNVRSPFGIIAVAQRSGSGALFMARRQIHSSHAYDR